MPSNDDDRFKEGDRHFRRQRDGYDEDDRPRRRPGAEPEFEATDILIPTGVSGYSIAACYLGLVSCFLPVAGLVFGTIALVCGIIALRKRKQNRKSGSYGAVTSDIRAVIGVVLGALAALINLPIAIIVLVAAFKD
jgi:hypothetical protein